MKKISFFLLIPLIAILVLLGCTPSLLCVSKPKVYVRKNLHLKDTIPTLTVLPFESPSYQPEVGMYTAKLFFKRLLEQKEFEKVSFLQETDWYERGKTWEGRTELAVGTGRVRESDYILIGSVDRYLEGRTTSNKVTVTVRLVEVETGKVTYFATCCGTGKPGKTFLIFDTEAGEPTPSTTSVLNAVVDHIVKDCFNRRWGVLKNIFSSLNHTHPS